MRRIARVAAVVVVVLLVAAVATAIAWPALWQPIWPFLYDYRWWWALAAVVAVAVLLLWLLYTALRRPWGAPWRAHVLATADAFQYQLEALPAGATPTEPELRRTVGQAVQHHLEVARKAAWPQDDKRLPIGQQLVDWWTGAPVEAASVNLHEAEIALAQILPDDQIQARIPEALARLQTIEVTDPRRRAAETQLASNLPANQRRAAFQSAVRVGLELKDQQHDRLRGFRNVVLTTAVGLMLLVVALCAVGAWKPDALPLCFGPPPTTATTGQPPPPVQGPTGVACPSGEAPPTPGTQPRRLPAPGDVTLVALLGLLGGGLSGAFAIRGLQGSSTPYDIPVALSLLKLPSGALTALVGLLFIRGGFIPGLSQLDSQPQILAYAFLFGIAQQSITRLVDRQGQEVLRAAAGGHDTTTPTTAGVQEQVIEALRHTVRAPEFEQQLAQAVRAGVRGEPLDNYAGYVVALIGGADHKPVDREDAAVRLDPGGRYELTVALQPGRPDTAVYERLVIEDGREKDEVTFRLAVLSTDVSFQPRGTELRVERDQRAVSDPLRFAAPHDPGEYDAWIQVHQKNRLVQVLPLALRVGRS
jgi:hypothetical protein